MAADGNTNYDTNIGLRHLALTCLLLATGLLAAEPSVKSDFNRDIRPILSENCYKCHGPDEGARKAKLRLDVRAEALKPAKSGQVAIVPGSPEKSELIERVTATDLDDRMPPFKTGKKLSQTQIEALRRWIAQGAAYAPHWAYVKPVRPDLPVVKNTRWARNPIDRFILARLEREGLRPSPEADRYVLARRVSLDLIGLPPTPEDVNRFVHDRSPLAYENMVDRFLQDPAFGEHWARLWLDLARYADSAGYADDPPRTIWAYRDYVIRSFNANKPFDLFTIEQIAGDLLDNPPGEEELVATGFHRNTMTNNEGGTQDEEFRNAAVVDRVNTTMAVWMGTTIACAQCHNHKYDPITQQEYFKFFAILNNTQDADRNDEAPVLEVYTPELKPQRAKLQAQIAEIERTFNTPTPESLAVLDRWTRDVLRSESDSAPISVVEILAATAALPKDQAQVKVSQFYRADLDPELKTERDKLRQLKRDLAKLKPTTVPIMREMAADKRRTTHIQFRGNYLSLGDAVTEGVPAAFQPLPAGAATNRLALANWLMDENNPLTARVVANRFWEQIFGAGIVRTVGDFGSQGDLPTHPELLEWLATELVAQKWNVKAFLKMLVCSATYRQSSRVTPQLLERDPDNTLLSRGPRFRMGAEVVHDQALAVSGLLSHKMYGPPVRPPRPVQGLTAAFGSSLDWKTSEGEDRYRRALYIEWRRTSPYPSMATFDAPNREVCMLKRPRSNTPLQALVTLNDPVYVEAAQALARRMAQAPGSPSEKLQLGFQLCLARPPASKEVQRLVDFYQEAHAKFAKDPEQAKSLATEQSSTSSLDAGASDLAAWTAVGNVLLNLDETLMRP